MSVDQLDVLHTPLHDEEIAPWVPLVEVVIEEKALDHWLLRFPSLTYTRGMRYACAATALQAQPDDVILDVGADDDLLVRTVGEGLMKRAVSTCVGIASGGSDVASYGEFNSTSFDGLHPTIVYFGHSFEHLSGSADTAAITRACRLMPARGRILIEPLFLGASHLNVIPFGGDAIPDEGATLIETKSNFPGEGLGMGFARIYSMDALLQRVVWPAQSEGFACQILCFRTERETLPDMERYRYKRSSVNFPFRALMISSDRH